MHLKEMYVQSTIMLTLLLYNSFHGSWGMWRGVAILAIGFSSDDNSS